MKFSGIIYLYLAHAYNVILLVMLELHSVFSHYSLFLSLCPKMERKEKNIQKYYYFETKVILLICRLIKFLIMN